MNFKSISGWAGGLLLSLSAAWMCTTPALAQGHEHGGLWNPKQTARMLDAVNATPAQRQQIEQIANSLKPDLQSLHQAHRQLMSKSMQLLAAPVIDEAAIEQNRQAMLAQHDQLSKRMSTAFIDMAKVLTPDQRAQWAERMKTHMAHRGGHRGSSTPVPATEPVR